MATTGKYAGILIHSSLVSLLSGHLWVLLETNNQEHFHQYHQTTGQRNLELSFLNGSDCTEHSTSGSFLFSGVQKITKTFLTNESSNTVEQDSIAIVTKECLTEASMIHSIIARLTNVPSAVVSISPSATDILPGVIRLVPSNSYILKAIAALFQSLLWNRMGLIYDYSIHFMTLYEEFQYFKKENISLTCFSHLLGSNIEKLWQRLDDYAVRVLVLLTQDAHPILCAAYKRGMRWPHYGWLVYGYSMPDINDLPTCEGSHSYLEGIVFPTYYADPIKDENMLEAAVSLIQKASAAAYQKHTDFESALLEMVVPGIPINTTLHSIQNDSPAVYFVQVINNTPSTVATVYNGKVPHNKWLLEEELPKGRLPVLVNTVYPTWLGALEVTVCGTLITLTLLLYIYYRNEPEVKATSWSLSLLMFLGCYLITLYLITFMLRGLYPPTKTFELCPLLVWLSGLGLSYPLILAVLLVKLVRVYRIFYHYSHIGKLCSDKALAVYVLLLLSPLILSLTVMTSLKAYWWSKRTIVHIDHVEVVYVCAGDLSPYYTFNAVCIISLVASVIAAAIKTKNLRYMHFRDAKKVNMFAFLVVLNGLSGLIMYKLFSDRGLYKSAYITIHVVHCCFILLCLGFLFMPKLILVLLRKYSSRNNKDYYSGFIKDIVL